MRAVPVRQGIEDWQWDIGWGNELGSIEGAETVCQQ